LNTQSLKAMASTDSKSSSSAPSPLYVSAPAITWDMDIIGDKLSSEWKQHSDVYSPVGRLASHDNNFPAAWRSIFEIDEDLNIVWSSAKDLKTVSVAFFDTYTKMMYQDYSLYVGPKSSSKFKTERATMHDFAYDKETGEITYGQVELCDVKTQKWANHICSPSVKWHVKTPEDMMRGLFLKMIPMLAVCEYQYRTVGKQHASYLPLYHDRSAIRYQIATVALPLLKIKSIAFGGYMEPIGKVPVTTCMQKDCTDESICQTCYYCNDMHCDCVKKKPIVSNTVLARIEVPATVKPSTGYMLCQKSPVDDDGLCSGCAKQAVVLEVPSWCSYVGEFAKTAHGHCDALAKCDDCGQCDKHCKQTLCKDETVQEICTMCKKPYIAQTTDIKMVTPEKEKFCTHLCNRFGCTNIQNHDECRRCNNCCKCEESDKEPEPDKEIESEPEVNENLCKECKKELGVDCTCQCGFKGKKGKSKRCLQIAHCHFCGLCRKHCDYTECPKGDEDVDAKLGITPEDVCPKCKQTHELCEMEGCTGEDKCEKCGKDGVNNGICAECEDKQLKAKAKLCKNKECGPRKERLADCIKKCGYCSDCCFVAGAAVPCNSTRFGKCSRVAACCICRACRLCCVAPTLHKLNQ
jgi:hypothetical protein